MEFCSLSSGSSGNCHYVASKNMEVLIDAGLSGVKIEKLLKNIDKKAEDLDAILITHEHLDHIKGAGVLSRRYDIPIYANEKTWLAMEDKIGKISVENRHIFKTGKEFLLKDLGVKAIDIYHDAEDPVGYLLHRENKKISLVTDTGKLDGKIISEIKDSDLYLIESNHDVQMLRNGSYPYHLKERVLSDHGHLSNKTTSKALRDLVRARGEIVLLGHLSKDNNTPKMAFNEAAFSLIELGVDIKRDVILSLTHRERNTDIFTI